MIGYVVNVLDKSDEMKTVSPLGINEGGDSFSRGDAYPSSLRNMSLYCISTMF